MILIKRNIGSISVPTTTWGKIGQGLLDITTSIAPTLIQVKGQQAQLKAQLKAQKKAQDAANKAQIDAINAQSQSQTVKYVTSAQKTSSIMNNVTKIAIAGLLVGVPLFFYFRRKK